MGTFNLSIIIASWNTQKLLADCLDSLVESVLEAPVKIEIIVIDNGSTDTTAAYLKQLALSPPFYLRLISNQKNLGFAAANNQGLAAARGEFVMLLNSDTLVPPQSLNQLLTVIEASPNIVLSPLLLLPGGQSQDQYYMRFPNLWQIVFYHHPLLRPLASRFSFLTRRIYFSPHPEPFPVDQLPATAIIASRAVWQQVGAIREQYRFFFEDVDWSWRAAKLGIARVVDPGIMVYHLGGASWKIKRTQHKQAFYQQYFASLLQFVQLNYPASRYWVYKLAILVNFLFTGKIALFFQFINHSSQDQQWLNDI